MEKNHQRINEGGGDISDNRLFKYITESKQFAEEFKLSDFVVYRNFNGGKHNRLF